MRRRNARERRGGVSGKTLFQIVLALAAGRPVFTADYYAVDGVSGKVASFIDWNDATHTLAQATSASQVALPAAHADFANRLCATFSGAQYYVSNRAATTWSAGHNGTGETYWMTCTPLAGGATQRPLATRTGGSSVGWSLGWDSGTTINYAVGNGTSLIVNANSETLAPLSTPLYFEIGYLEGAPTPEAAVRKKSAVSANADSSAAPSAAAPAATLSLGGFAAGTVLASLLFRELVAMPYPSAAQRIFMQNNYQLQTYGIAP